MREVPPDIATKLLAASESFASHFETVRMDEISRASGIPRATLYYYFASKDDVLSFVVRTELEGMAKAVEAAFDGDSDAAIVLGRIIHAQLSYLAANRGAAQLLVANLGKVAELPELMAGINAAFHEPLERILKAGMADSSLPDVDPQVGAVAFFGAVMTVGLRFLVVETEATVDEITTKLLAMFLYGR